MKIFKWDNLRLVLMFALVAFLYSFTSMRNEHRKLAKSVVVFTDDSNPFIRQEAVNKLLIENKTDASAIQKVDLDLNQLEKSINANPMIEKSEVFVSIDGVLKAVVKQKTPIARLFNETGSFYIDYQGSIMPLSDEFTARVPIVSGEINKLHQDEFSQLLRFVYDDDFLKKNIIGIQISPSGRLKMRNRNFDYEIEFGQTVNIERKFNNYKAFYQKAVQDSSLHQYKKINLTFTQQVVCTK
ncbi:cell division protein FtsQ [Flavobacterium sp. CYK-4]|uniref:cell division protein FtsQ/DivIB n=1 Tax=Flavobacterium lotistagni TaxID=2709660 RepID=UPI00140E6288|nr:cell division protein FtsQ/DivIB [Flavobacterium lotistagni]NHM05749.1 cell division protein FtsQ [Flavobacterium lotistagni]